MATLYDLMEPIIPVASAVIAGAVSTLAWKAYNLMAAHIAVMNTDQARARFKDAADTGTGMLQKQIAEGSLALKDVQINSPAMVKAVQHVESSVAPSVALLGKSETDIANRILGGLGKAIGQDPTVVSVPELAAPAAPPPAQIVKLVEG